MRSIGLARHGSPGVAAVLGLTLASGLGVPQSGVLAQPSPPPGGAV